jgi:hypothetical protein
MWLREVFAKLHWAGPVDGFWKWPLRTVQVLTTFSLVCFAWIFFRAHSLSDATYVVGHLFDGLRTLPFDLRSLAFIKMNILMRNDKWDFVIALICIALLLTVHFIQRNQNIGELIARQSRGSQWALYYAAIIVILFFGAFNSSQQFIYFQF